MIFQRGLVREFANLSSAVFLTLFAIALTTRLIRLLGQAAGGKIPTEAVLGFLGFFALYALPVLLSLTLFVAILLTITRSYRDSEMVIWFSSGLSLAAWLRPVFAFALPIVLLIAALSLVISPWAAQRSEQFRSRVDARDEISRVTPGVFGETSNRERVFFVESITGDETAVRNVFVSSVQQQRSGIMVSRTGHVETAPNGDRFLVLGKGRRYEGNPGEAEFRVMEFERYAMRIDPKEGEQPEATLKSLPTLELLRNPINTNLSELLWRVGVPISALILAVLAIPLSFVNPRAGRSINLLFALLIYVLYSNLLSVSQARVAQDRLSFSLAVWLVHAVMLGVVFAMFAHRMGWLRWRR
jgi:lipopolysaccharide export system permease protein